MADGLISSRFGTSFPKTAILPLGNEGMNDGGCKHTRQYRPVPMGAKKTGTNVPELPNLTAYED